MRAMVFDGRSPHLSERELPDPTPGPGQLLIRIRACGVCRTDLHVVDGELAHPKTPVIPGHEIVGVVAGLGEGVTEFRLGERVGVPWLGHTCGQCRYCRGGRENLCDRPAFTGYTLDGGYAEWVTADSRYCLPIPARYSDAEAAPLLCAGLIGYRTLAMAGDARRIGIYGFGAAAHIVAQVARHQQRIVYAFTRPGDAAAQQLARRLGARWAGGSDAAPPEPLDAALIFAPVGALVPAALAAVVKGGIVVCGGIHMSAIPSFPYDLLWGERRLVSVANLTREDGHAFMRIAGQVPLRIETTLYPLREANRALSDLREGRLTGAAVLTTGD
ncbi:MAG: zinc-dependent alcohol dehydrogenase family protein [Trinickia sp.]|uniref:zinc-dependent alcohol dehydrogenase family protein n=1 Tax=Trinickia sp. TaxID=2571163 RepID=UPI003F7D129C